MLSKLSKLVMGLLWAKPMNPYEIAKLVNMDVIQDWFPLTAPSIYTTVKNLERDGYITGVPVWEGKQPLKTLYSLTEKGEQALTADLLAGMESYEAFASDFGISLFHIGVLSKEDALRYAQKRAEHLTALLAKAQKRLADSLPQVPFNMKLMLTYNVYRLEAALKVTRKLLGEIEGTADWNTSFVRFMG